MDPNDRDYTNGEITVHWRPNYCIHATTCYRELIEVFNPRKRPWVDMQGAPTERIIEIVRKCPTRALTYDWSDPSRVSDKPDSEADEMPDSEKDDLQESNMVEINVMKDGPYVVAGNFKITGSDDKELKKMVITSLCRCGNSDSMPLCDGSHRMSDFSDNED
ncbi:MAG: hypothetical protein AMS27_16430 [Bacteroides sp. SM23_62_1]|nr:MAG: hypothetical protein AMS27_16430 [Bacteroides sp. SM23_62_1]